MKAGTLLDLSEIAPELLDQFFLSEPERALRYPLRTIKISSALLRSKELGLWRTLFGKHDLKSHIERLRAIGATHFEIPGDMVSLLPAFKEWWWKQLPYLISLRKEEITYSLHVQQFPGLFIDSYAPNIRRGAVLEIKEIYEFFKDLDPLCVLHLGSERFFRYTGSHFGPVFKGELRRAYGDNYFKVAAAQYVAKQVLGFLTKFVTREVLIENLLHSLEEIRDFMPLEKLCIENLEYTDLDGVMRWVPEEIPVSVWLDTGHLMIQKWHEDKNCFEHFFEKHGRRIRGVHLHDVVQISEEVFDKHTRQPVLQDHKPLEAKGCILPLRKTLRLIHELEQNTGRVIPVVLELYYCKPYSSLEPLAKEIKTFDSA